MGKHGIKLLATGLILLSMTMGCGSKSNGLSFKPMDSTLVLTNANYTLTINRSPYNFTVTSQGHMVLSSIPCTASSSVSATGSYLFNSTYACTFSAAGYNPTSNGANVYLHSDQTGWITYNFLLSNKMIKVSVSSQNSSVKNIGDAFSTSASGHWYGQGELGNYLNPVNGTIEMGQQWFPLETGNFTRCPLETADQNNLTTPLWLTSNGAGLFVDSYGPLCMSMGNGIFTLTGNSNLFSYYILVDNDIPSEYQDWISTNFTYKKAWSPVSLPAPAMFQGPVWSTWAEYLYGIDQTNVIGLAQSITSLGFPHSILEIDDKWQKNWGDTDFDPAKFPDTKAMIAQLHGMGFTVSLWVPPFVDNNSTNFNATTEKYFVQSNNGGVSLIAWWDTFGTKKAGLINFADPAVMNWWAGLLGNIVSNDGIDGFKFDAGEANWFPLDGVTTGYLSPNQYSDFYITINKHVPAMEFRSGWFAQNDGQIMREYDKDSIWTSDNGLASVLPQMFSMEMVGYPFVLPDMIGGNGYTGWPSSELYIRWVEMNAFMPLMQFSMVPWDSKIGGYPTQVTTDIARYYAGIHQSLTSYMIRVAQSSAQTGMPMVKPLFFDYPSDQNTYTISDEFLLGDTYLVCPVVTPGASSRNVYLPAGTWADYFTHGTFTGPATLTGYPATITTIPVFVKQP
jgi:alpha-glucosidase (family GH31 glycosyl hydrolase)